MAIDEIPHHPFTLRQLQYIVAVADELSFSKAAERCRVAQPSLSTQVAQVEDALGLQLFERDRRRVLVTLAGEEFIERARSLLTEADDLVDTARRAADPFSGTLRLGVIPTVAAYALPHLTPHLRARLPGLTILWTEDRTSALRTRLEAGQLDAAFWALEADLGAVEHVVVAIDPFVLATSATDHLGAEVGPLPLEALQDRDVLLLDDGHCLREQAISHCARAGARERAFRATSLPTLCQMVAAGAGVTLLPALAAAIEGGRSALRLRPLTDPVPSRTLILAWRRRAPMARALAQLAGHMREGLEGTLPSCIPLDPPRLP